MLLEQLPHRRVEELRHKNPRAGEVQENGLSPIECRAIGGMELLAILESHAEGADELLDVYIHSIIIGLERRFIIQFRRQAVMLLVTTQRYPR